MWLMELLCGVLLLEMAESLRRGGEGQTGTGWESLTLPGARTGGWGLGEGAGGKRDCRAPNTESAAPPAKPAGPSSLDLRIR